MIRFLIRLVKVLAWSVAGIVFALLLTFLYYDLAEFQPRQADIARLIAEAQPTERHPPETLRRLLLTEHSGDLSWSVTRKLLTDLQVPWVMHGNLGWNTTGLLWQHLVRLHLSHEEQLVILCSRTLLGRRAFGYEAGAQVYFQRPLERLTEKELALLVVFSRWPSRWDNSVDFRDNAIKARDALLARAAG